MSYELLCKEFLDSFCCLFFERDGLPRVLFTLGVVRNSKLCSQQQVPFEHSNRVCCSILVVLGQLALPACPCLISDQPESVLYVAWRRDAAHLLLLLVNLVNQE